MHGIRKEKITEARKLQSQKKGRAFNETMRVTLAQKKKNEYTLESLKNTTTLLKGNTDVYTFWNFRREIIERLLPEEYAFSVTTLFLRCSINRDKRRENPIEFLWDELKFNATCIKSNAKSYWTWHHRKWLLKLFTDLPPQERAGEEKTVSEVISSELNICRQFLMLDSRNFHCWGYRNFLSFKLTEDKNSEGNLDADISLRELTFSREMIEKNFSNYSAWHRRSKLLERRATVDIKDLETYWHEVISDELILVHGAVFTDPNDESAWVYFRWLLTKALNTLPKSDSERILRAEYDIIDDLLGVLGEESDDVYKALMLSVSIAGTIGRLAGNDEEITAKSPSKVVKLEKRYAKRGIPFFEMSLLRLDSQLSNKFGLSIS